MTERRADIAADIAARTDSYFTRTHKIVERFGDKRVTYAIFLRRPVICAPRLMAQWIDAATKERGIEVAICVAVCKCTPLNFTESMPTTG